MGNPEDHDREQNGDRGDENGDDKPVNGLMSDPSSDLLFCSAVLAVAGSGES